MLGSPQAPLADAHASLPNKLSSATSCPEQGSTTASDTQQQSRLVFTRRHGKRPSNQAHGSKRRSTLIRRSLAGIAQQRLCDAQQARACGHSWLRCNPPAQVQACVGHASEQGHLLQTASGTRNPQPNAPNLAHVCANVRQVVTGTHQNLPCWWKVQGALQVACLPAHAHTHAAGNLSVLCVLCVV